jgi:hypothetical protein
MTNMDGLSFCCEGLLVPVFSHPEKPLVGLLATRTVVLTLEISFN